MTYKTYKEIPVWVLAHEFVLAVYEVTRTFHIEEKYSLISQVRRAVISVCANIAEGVSRKSTKELLQFLVISRASLVETEYHLFLAKDLNYLSDDEYQKLYLQYDEIHKQLSLWMSTLRRKGNL